MIKNKQTIDFWGGSEIYTRNVTSGHSGSQHLRLMITDDEGNELVLQLGYETAAKMRDKLEETLKNYEKNPNNI